MPTLTIDKQYQDGVVLTEEQLDAAFSSITTLLNTTGLGADNIQDGAIGPAEIQTNAITNTKLATNSVSTVKIQDEAVILAKLATAVRNFLVPTASIQPYGGDTAPAGWLVCDGTAVSRTTYADLFTVVGVRFGNGDGTTTFNLPDLRGRFLRMIDGSAARDPDSAARTAMNTGGATGNNIGSVQSDQFRSHSHNAAFGGSGSLVNSANSGGGSQLVTVTATGGNETRPVNAYVNMIIKI